MKFFSHRWTYEISADFLWKVSRDLKNIISVDEIKYSTNKSEKIKQQLIQVLPEISEDNVDQYMQANQSEILEITLQHNVNRSREHLLSSDTIDRFAAQEKFFHPRPGQNIQDLIRSELRQELALLPANASLSSAEINALVIQLTKSADAKTPSILEEFMTAAQTSHETKFCTKVVDERLGNLRETLDDPHVLSEIINELAQSEALFHGNNPRKNFEKQLQAKLEPILKSLGIYENVAGKLQQLLKTGVADLFQEKMPDWYAQAETKHGQEFCTETVTERTKISAEIYQDAIVEFSDPKYAKLSLAEIEKRVASRIKQADLLTGLKSGSPIKTELYQQINEQAKTAKSEIHQNRIDQAQTIIQNIDLSIIDRTDPKNKDFHTFSQNFKEIVWFGEETWNDLSVRSAAFQKFQELHKEFLIAHEDHEQSEKIQRTNMKDKWDSFTAAYKHKSTRYKNSAEFRADFLKQFGRDKAKAEAYFSEHPNFEKSFEKSFNAVQTEKISADFSKTISVISDPKIRAAIEKSFTNAKDNPQREAHLAYFEKGDLAGQYEQAIQTIRQQEAGLKDRLAKLSNSKSAQKLEKKLLAQLKNYENKKGTYNENFISPRTLTEDLAKLTEELDQIETKWNEDVQSGQNQIQSMSLSDLKNPTDEALKNPRNFARQFDVWMEPDVWEEVKDEFSAKIFELHKVWMKSLETNENPRVIEAKAKIENVTASDLDLSKTYNSYNEFQLQPALHEDMYFPEDVWQQVESDFEIKARRLYAEYLKTKNSAEKLTDPAAQAAQKTIDTLTADQLDFGKNYSDFTAFKRQPFFRNTISFPDKIWDQVQPFFEIKATELYAEYLKTKNSPSTRSGQGAENSETLNPNWENDLQTMNLDGLDLTNPDLAEKQNFRRALGEKFQIWMPDSEWKSKGEKLFTQKTDALHAEFLENSEKSAEYSNAEAQKIGGKYGLNFRSVQFGKIPDARAKMERLHVLLDKQIGLRKLLKSRESDSLPFFLNFLGRLNSDDFSRLKVKMQARTIPPDAVMQMMFDDPRRSYLAKEEQRKGGDSWTRFQRFGRNSGYDGESAIKRISLEEEKVIETEKVEIEAVEIEKPDENIADKTEEISHSTSSEQAVDFPEADSESETILENTNEIEADTSNETSEEIVDQIVEDEGETDEVVADDMASVDETENSENDQTVSESDDKSPDEITEILKDNSEETPEEASEISAEILEISEETPSVEEFFEQNDTTPIHFAELYCPNGISLQKLLERLVRYAELISDRNIDSQFLLDDAVKTKRVKNPRKIFVELADYLIEKDLKNIEELTFFSKEPKKSATASVSLELQGKRTFGMFQTSFEIECE